MRQSFCAERRGLSWYYDEIRHATGCSDREAAARFVCGLLAIGMRPRTAGRLMPLRRHAQPFLVWGACPSTLHAATVAALGSSLGEWRSPRPIRLRMLGAVRPREQS